MGKSRLKTRGNSKRTLMQNKHRQMFSPAMYISADAEGCRERSGRIETESKEREKEEEGRRGERKRGEEKKGRGETEPITLVNPREGKR